MSKAARSTIILSVGLVLVVSMAGWLSAQQSPTSAQPPGVSAPAQPDEDITSDIALTRASIQLRRPCLLRDHRRDNAPIRRSVPLSTERPRARGDPAW